MSKTPVDEPEEELQARSERKGPLVAVIGIFGILTAIIGIAAPIALFLWAVGTWSPTPITRVILLVFLAGILIHYVKTRPSKKIVYGLLGTGLVILIVRWMLGR